MNKQQTIRAILDAATEGNLSKAEDALDGYWQGWVDEKPELNKECILITATKYNRNDENLNWDYSIWQVHAIDGEDEDGNSGWYWGLLNGEGEEWGDIADLKADKYLVLQPISKKKVLKSESIPEFDESLASMSQESKDKVDKALQCAECENSRNNLIIDLAHKEEAIKELKEALTEVVKISDRKHDAWDKAKQLIQKHKP